MEITTCAFAVTLLFLLLATLSHLGFFHFVTVRALLIRVKGRLDVDDGSMVKAAVKALFSRSFNMFDGLAARPTIGELAHAFDNAHWEIAKDQLLVTDDEWRFRIMYQQFCEAFPRKAPSPEWFVRMKYQSTLSGKSFFAFEAVKAETYTKDFAARSRVISTYAELWRYRLRPILRSKALIKEFNLHSTEIRHNGPLGENHVG